MATAEPRASYDNTIADQIQRLQDAKADLKTAIESKGVPVDSSLTLGNYAQKVNLIEQGSPVPYIVNPLNGGQIGNSSSVGIITHQYNVNIGTIVSCSLYHTMLQHGTWGGFTAEDSDWGGTNTFPYKELYNTQNYNHDIVISISDSGLLSVSFNRSVSAVNEYPWQNLVNVGVIITLDNGVSLNDYFTIFSTFSCFIKGTKISLANGKKINVEDIDYDTELLVWNFDDGKYDKAKPLWIKKTQATTWYYKLKFSNGLELNVTGAYPEAHSLFSVEDGKFIHSNRLVGKKVYTLNGIATLDSCKEIHDEVEFYNIFTYYHLNLFANDILTSTSLNNIYPIKDMKFVRTQREPVFDYTKFSENWIVGARLKEQPTDVTKYCLDHIKLSK